MTTPVVPGGHDLVSVVLVGVGEDELGAVLVVGGQLGQHVVHLPPAAHQV